MLFFNHKNAIKLCNNVEYKKNEYLAMHMHVDIQSNMK